LSNNVLQHGHRPDALSDLSIVFLGRRCQFSTIPLQRLLDAGMRVNALFLSSNAPSGPAVRLRRNKPSISIWGGPGSMATESIEQIARNHAIPVYDVRRPLGIEFAATLRELAPDLMVASCFPWRIPALIRDEARVGGLNLHPSLLPRFRGPDPLFWTYYFGEQRTGATVHWLSDAFDAGEILAQSTFDLPNELPGDRLEAIAARIGADLLINVIAQLDSRKSDPRPQDETLASYQSWPANTDLLIDRNWSVQRALNFVAGVIPLGYSPRVATLRGTYVISSARRAGISCESASDSWRNETTACVTVADGAVEFTLE
jgi:methionyl-tRNA formyltransferase